MNWIKKNCKIKRDRRAFQYRMICVHMNIHTYIFRPTTSSRHPTRGVYYTKSLDASETLRYVVRIYSVN